MAPLPEDFLPRTSSRGRASGELALISELLRDFLSDLEDLAAFLLFPRRTSSQSPRRNRKRFDQEEPQYKIIY